MNKLIIVYHYLKLKSFFLGLDRSLRYTSTIRDEQGCEISQGITLSPTYNAYQNSWNNSYDFFYTINELLHTIAP